EPCCRVSGRLPGQRWQAARKVAIAEWPCGPQADRAATASARAFFRSSFSSSSSSISRAPVRISDGARADRARQKRKKAFGRDGKLYMLAIAGDRSTPSSINRNQGMRHAVAEAPMVVVEEEVYAAWTRENAAQQAESLYRRYPDVKLIWAGND